jgi:hypothetical protein
VRDLKISRIELVYFDGCPHVSRARDNLREAIAGSHELLTWSEWDVLDPSTPADFLRFGSPTVLVDGEDVTGKGGGSEGVACRADGAPSSATIKAQIA